MMMVVWCTVLILLGILYAYFCYQLWAYSTFLWSVWKETTFGAPSEEEEMMEFTDMPRSSPCADVLDVLTTSEFSRCTALKCVHLIKEVYRYSSRYPAPTTSRGRRRVLVMFYDDHRPIGAAYREGDTLWVVFRGSVSMKDLLRDTDVVQVHLPGDRRVHRGFYEMYRQHVQKAWTDLWNGPEALARGVKSVVFTGHSLGVPLAALCLCEEEVADKMPDNALVLYAFGPPRFGNEVFVRAVHSRASVFPVINRHDIIPTMPLSVTMNFVRPTDPYLYSDLQNMMYIDRNHGSWKRNHSLRCYASALNTL